MQAADDRILPERTVRRSPLLPLPPITTGAGTRAAHVTSTQLSESHQRAAYLRAPKELYGSLYA